MGYPFGTNAYAGVSHFYNEYFVFCAPGYFDFAIFLIVFDGVIYQVEKQIE